MILKKLESNTFSRNNQLNKNTVGSNWLDGSSSEKDVEVAMDHELKKSIMLYYFGKNANITLGYRRRSDFESDVKYSHTRRKTSIVYLHLMKDMDQLKVQRRATK